MTTIFSKIISWLLSIIMILSPASSIGSVEKIIDETAASAAGEVTITADAEEEPAPAAETEKIELLNPYETVETEAPEYAELNVIECDDEVLNTASESSVLSGMGTEEAPYLIYTEADLIAVALGTVENSLKSYYSLQSDIVLSADTWTPIGGTETDPFAGVFEGNGHRISSTSMFQSTGLSGLFGVNTGTIRNLTVDVTITETATDTGALVSLNKGRVEGCTANGTIASTANKYIGGMVGYNTGVITTSVSNVVVTAPNSTVGGLLGRNYNGGIVQYCGATAYYDDNTNGLTGRIVGGLIGEQYANGTTTTTKCLNCYATGKIVGSEIAGGLIGKTYKNYGYSYIEYCYAKGVVTCSTSGGLIGQEANYHDGASLVRFSYYNKANTGNKIGFGVGTSNLKKQNTFYGWNFTNIWSVPANDTINGGYPVINIRGIEELDISGIGTQEDPYVITEEKQLFYITAKKLDNAMTAYYSLANDIEITANFWTPIGQYGEFKGVFDGNGHTISGIKIANTYFDSCGLFAYNSGTIKNLTVTDFSIEGNTYTGSIVGNNSGTVSGCEAYIEGYDTDEATGLFISPIYNVNSDYVGGAVGYNTGLISSCITEVDIKSANTVIGGLLGKNNNGGIVEYCGANGEVTGKWAGGLIGEQSAEGTTTTTKCLNCYATGKIVGSEIAGGLIGKTYNNYGYSYIEYCYAKGVVTCSTSGGLIGQEANYNGGYSFVRYSYYNKANTGNKIGFSTTTSNLKKQSTFYGWDFDHIWSVSSSVNSGYPYINLRDGEKTYTLSGCGDEDDPYMIYTEEDLWALVLDKGEYQLSVRNYYKLANDITVTATHWTPIGGNGMNNFNGFFDGDGHTIYGITLSNNYYDYIGLFGYNTGTIKNLNVVANIEGINYAGGLVAYNAGTVSNCSSSGSVTNSVTDKSAGGLVGYNVGTVTLSSSSASVGTAGNVAGGLVGRNFSGGLIQYSFANGEVTGKWAGGLIGEQSAEGTTTTTKCLNCYATGKVIGSERAGGLIGSTYRNYGYSYVEYCYAKGVVTCSTSGGLIGQENNYNSGYSYVHYSYYNNFNSGNTIGFGVPVSAMTEQSTFYMWNFNNIWAIDPLVNDGYPYINIRGRIKAHELEGSGDEEDPYMIYTEEDLWALVDGTYNIEAISYYQLQNDIQLTANFWTPIGGNGGKAFNAIFDGNGYTISGLRFPNGYYSQVGLFGKCTGTIKNLTVEAIINGEQNIGVICAENSGTIDHCNVSGLVLNSNKEMYNAGGIAGVNNGTIQYCTSSVTVNTEAARAGSLVGYHNGGTIKYCYATGGAIGKYAGGLIGEQSSTGGKTIKTQNCYAMGKAVGTDRTGGLIGNLHTNNGSNVNYVECCYAAGKIGNTGNKGGLIGIVLNGNNNVVSSYYDSSISEMSDIDRGTPLDTNAMKTQSSFVGWDFDDIWAMDASKNGGYAYLQDVEPVTPVAPTDVTLNYSTKDITVGESFTLIPTIIPSDATNKSVKWTSSNYDVAYVTQFGKVSGKSEGTATITVTTADGGFIATCTVNVTDEPAPELVSISVKTTPTKTTYYVGDTLDTTGLTLTATYSNGTTETVSSGFTCTPTSFTSAGTKTITVNYESKTTTFTVTVKPVDVSSISVKTMPTKTTYYVGDTLDTTGLTLTVNYNNSTTGTVSSGFTCTPTSFTSAGTKTITVSYEGKTTTFNVTVLPVDVSNIEIKTMPTKTTYYVGDTLNTTGLTLTVNYSNGTTGTVSSGFTCTPTSFTSAGTKTITVSYGGKTTTFNVTVSNVPVAADGTLSVSNAKGKTGDTVDVTVLIKDNPGIIALMFDLIYDNSELTLISVTNGEIFTQSTSFTPGNNLTVVPFTVSWEDGLNDNHTDDGILVTFTFEIIGTVDAGENRDVPVTITLDQSSTYNFDLMDVPFAVENGYVTITGRIAGDANDDGEVNSKDVTVMKRFIAKWDGVTINEMNADVDGDGNVTSKDVTILRRYLAKWDGYELI